MYIFPSIQLYPPSGSYLPPISLLFNFHLQTKLLTPSSICVLTFGRLGWLGVTVQLTARQARGERSGPPVATQWRKQTRSAAMTKASAASALDGGSVVGLVWWLKSIDAWRCLSSDIATARSLGDLRRCIKVVKELACCLCWVFRSCCLVLCDCWCYCWSDGFQVVKSFRANMLLVWDSTCS